MLECLNKSMSSKEVIHFLGISKRTLYRWLKQKKGNRLFEVKKPIRTVFKIDPEVLQSAISEGCSMYQKDLANHLQVSQSGISRVFKCLKITQKIKTYKELRRNMVKNILSKMKFKIFNIHNKRH